MADDVETLRDDDAATTWHSHTHTLLTKERVAELVEAERRLKNETVVLHQGDDEITVMLTPTMTFAQLYAISEILLPKVELHPDRYRVLRDVSGGMWFAREDTTVMSMHLDRLWWGWNNRPTSAGRGEGVSEKASER